MFKTVLILAAILMAVILGLAATRPDAFRVGQ